MTTLGIVFALAYLIGFVRKGRMGLLVVAAAAIPFTSSSALIVGPVAVPPFYLGALLYLPAAYARFGFSKRSTLPLALVYWSILVTIVGPAIFSGMPVTASGLGIDAQAARPSALEYSISNLAQIVYLVINIAFVLVLSNSEEKPFWIPAVPAVVGTSVAVVAFAADRLGIDWQQNLFRNNITNSYAYVQSHRFAAQFAEPSHLGSFALASAVILFAYLVALRPRPLTSLAILLLVLSDLVLVVSSTSLTAVAGGAVFFVGVALWWFYSFFFRQAALSLRYFGFTLALLVGILVFLPEISNFFIGIIEYKLDRGTSIASRTAADARSWRVFLDSAGFGVGLGSNRSSSLLPMLLSQIGLIGTTLFLVMVGQGVHAGLQSRFGRVYVAGLIAILAPALIGYPDFVSPMMWLLIGYCWSSVPHGDSQVATISVTAAKALQFRRSMGGSVTRMGDRACPLTE